MTLRLMPPESGLYPTIAVNGRTYTCQLGSVIDVPDQDGAVMAHNGWILVANGGGTGTTANRPAKPAKRQIFCDQTLGRDVVFDGIVWRDPATGAIV